MMNAHAKKKLRRLVLRREQVRQLDADQLGRMLGGVGQQTYSAGPCTETCGGCQHTTAINSDGDC